MSIFAYGCSFTSYNWPSYADILGLEYEVYNRGASGSGNERIFYCFMQDVKQGLITSDDIVIIQWSGTNRFNYLKPNGKWIGDGNIALPQNKHILDRIKEWYNVDYEIEKSANIVLSAKAVLEQINCKNLQMALLPIPEADENFLDNNLESSYVGDYTFSEFSWKTLSDAVYVDSHPTVMQHYSLACRIAKKLELEFDLDLKPLKKLHKQILKDNTFDKRYRF